MGATEGRLANPARKVVVALLLVAVSAILVLAMSPVRVIALEENEALAAASMAEDHEQATVPPTPEASSWPYSGTGYVSISWTLPDNPDGTSNDGMGTVDHFNIYCDRRLVAKVDRSAVSEYVQYNDHSVRSYSWSAVIDVPDSEIEHEWYVASVSPDGTEGHPSEATWAGSSSGMQIRCHTAWYSNSYRDEATGQDRPCMLVRINPYNAPGTLDWLEFWRAEGMDAPDTSGEPYMRVPKNHAISGYYSQHDLEDFGVEPGKTYTYTVRGTDGDGVQTGFYTFTVKAVMASAGAAIYYGMEGYMPFG